MRKQQLLVLITLYILSFMGCSDNSTKNYIAPTNGTILYVHEKTLSCSDGVMQKQCLQVRYKPSEEWEYFYQDIKGFNYEEGYRYKLTVKIEEVTYGEPIADAPNTNFSLIEILQQTLIENGAKYEL